MERSQERSSELVSELSEQYKKWLEVNTYFSPTTLSNYFYVVRRLLHKYPLKSLTLNELNLFLTEHDKTYFNTVTVRGALVKFCEWKGLKEWIPNIKKIRGKGRKNPPSEVCFDDIKKLFGSFKDQTCADVFTIQALSGCRQVEAWLIERRQVQFKDGYALINVRQKGGRFETVVMQNVDLAEEVFGRECYKGKKYPFLCDDWQALSSNQILDRHYKGIRERYRRAWRSACTKAGLPQYRSHDARRALGRAVYDKFGIHAAKKVLRHKKIETTAAYIEGLKVDVAQVLKEVVK